MYQKKKKKKHTLVVLNIQIKHTHCSIRKKNPIKCPIYSKCHLNIHVAKCIHIGIYFKSAKIKHNENKTGNQ